jgi:heptosyltransferase-2
MTHINQHGSPKKAVLIIKHGFSETCDHKISPIVSFGDVFRCTCLLEVFKGCHVTWITAVAAKELLAGNHFIDRLILADSPEELESQQIPDHYHQVINLEKQRDWCEFAASLSAEKKYGFKDGTGTGSEAFYPASAAALDQVMQRHGYRALQDTLFGIIGQEWTGQRYILGYQPRVEEIYDIGLNCYVGPKWPTKAWPMEHWRQLHYQLTDKNYAVCWQQSLNSIRQYIDWLASCRVIITTDSLGLHLGLALNRKMVALFGATASEQIHMYGNGIKITPPCERPCLPCFQARCDYEQSCMEFISAEMVVEMVELLDGVRQTPIKTGYDVRLYKEKLQTSTTPA